MLGSWQGVNWRKKVENPCFGLYVDFDGYQHMIMIINLMLFMDSSLGHIFGACTPSREFLHCCCVEKIISNYTNGSDLKHLSIIVLNI